MELQSSTSSSLINNFQNQSLTRKVELLEQKLALNEKDYQNKIISLTEQINSLSSSEIKLRTQLSNKDKALYELNNIIKEYQNEVITLKKQLCFTEEKLSTISCEFSSIKTNCTNISSALNLREEAFKQMEENYAKALNTQAKNENKIKELIEVLNQYSDEVSTLNTKCSVLEKENFDFKILNMNLSNELKQSNYENKNFNLNIQTMNNDIEKSQQCNQELTQQNQKLQFEIQNLQNDIANLNQRYNSILNENEHLKQCISQIQTDNSKLQSDLNANIKLNQHNLQKFSQNESNSTNIINEANDNIKLLTNWVNSYMSNFYSDLVSIPEIPLRSSKENRIGFDQLKNALTHARESINYQLQQAQLLAKQNNINVAFKEQYDKINDEYKILEKRYKNLVTEMELKQLQINSLEEIVNKKNNKGEITLGNTNNSNMEELIKKVRQLENDKQNIIKDNVILMNEINSLRQKVSVVRNK